MKERLGKLLEFCLDEGRRHYDPEAGLIGDFDPRFYTEKMLALSLRSLHPYRDSLTFALLLLIAGGKDEKISAVLESFCRHAPEPDGRLKWFLEEKHIRDGNGTFFSVEPLLLMEHCFGGELPEFQRKQVISEEYVSCLCAGAFGFLLELCQSDPCRIYVQRTAQREIFPGKF